MFKNECSLGLFFPVTTGEVRKENGINLMTLLLKNLNLMMKLWSMNVLEESIDQRFMINVSISLHFHYLLQMFLAYFNLLVRNIIWKKNFNQILKLTNVTYIYFN